MSRTTERTEEVSLESTSNEMSQGSLNTEIQRLQSHDGSSSLTNDNKNDQFLEACRHGNLSMVQELLQSGTVDVNYRGEDGLTPVLSAAWTGTEDLFHILLKHGSNLSMKLDNGSNVLHLSCLGGNVGIVNFLITKTDTDMESKGMLGRTAIITIHIDSRDQYGRTPVMAAACMGNRKVFDLLVQKGCDLSVVDKHKNNILHVACFSDNVDIVDYILSNTTIHIDSRGRSGKTPVMFAVQSGNSKVFDFLVQKGCDLSVVDGNKNNILHVACFSDNVDIVDYIISNTTIHIDSKGKYGKTPVMFAAQNGKRKVFDFLVQRCCDLTVEDEEKNNILHFACCSDNVDIVDYILSNTTIHIDSRGQYGRTPVMFAAEKGKRKVFDFLVQQGCDLKVEDDHNNNILHFACFSGNVDIVDYIISNTTIHIDSRGLYGLTPVMAAGKNGNKKVFDFLAQRGCDLTVEDQDENNVLHVACFSNNVDIVDYIISNTTIHIDSRNQNGRTPVMTAAENGNRKVFDFLVQRGCDLSVLDEENKNILHVACFSDNVDIVDYIISNTTIHIDSRDQYGRTPVMTAAENGNKKVLDFLVHKGCDLTIEDEEKTKLLHVACFSDNEDIVDYIISNFTIHIDCRDQYGRTPVMAAAVEGNRKVFDFLVQKGCDLSVMNEHKNNVLHFACFSDNVDIVDYIISNTPIHIDSRGQYGKTPVMFAAQIGNKKVFDFLVQKGCDLSVLDENKNNILHVACFSDNIDIVDYILSNTNIHIDSRGQKGKTPVMFAAQIGNRKVFDFLVQRGCDLSEVDCDGYTVLHSAAFGDDPHIIDYILLNTEAEDDYFL